MIVRTSDLIGPDDSALESWIILELPSVPPTDDGVDRHIFGWSPTAFTWQISSRILDETPEYIETRSRKYFKIGDTIASIPKDGINQLINFLHAWRVDNDTIESIVESLESKHG